MRPALAYLRSQEWSAGEWMGSPTTGQCPACEGYQPGEWPGGRYTMTFGHWYDCDLALAIQDLGGIVVWRDFWQGARSTVPMVSS